MTRILVTGSSGHLGEALVRTLREQGKDVVGLDILPSPFTDIVGSVADPNAVSRAMHDVTAVLHTATLHKPHVATHSRQAFIDTNITGTLVLLEAAARAQLTAFVFTSTTSTFGDALVPPPGAPAAWIDESVVPIPKNIYGMTKVAAEDLCALARRNQGVPCLVLRTSRFFPEDDDDAAARTAFAPANLKANEFLYRRADIEDIVSAHLLALQRATDVRFERLIISATTPLSRADAAELRSDAAAVVARVVPGYRDAYARLGWRMTPSIDRVYDNARARSVLGWEPTYDFATVVARAADSHGDIRSPLARTIGEKGYGNVA